MQSHQKRFLESSEGEDAARKQRERGLMSWGRGACWKRTVVDDPSHFFKSLREDKESKGWLQGDLWKRTVVVGDPLYFLKSLKGD